MMTRQEQFDTMVSHLREQGRPCEDMHRTCKYRHEGMKCAVGALISDDEYVPGMEGMEAAELIYIYGLALDTTLCTRMQKIHDTLGADHWEKQFERVAEFFDLMYTSKEEK